MGAIAIILILGIGVPLYFLPTIIAFRRGHGYKGVIFALNLVAGWTGALWVVALVWSLWPADRTLVDPIGNPVGAYGAGAAIGHQVRAYHAAASPSLQNFTLNMNGGSSIPLVPGQTIAHSTSPRLAVVEAHPSDPNVWGLRNLTSSPWRATIPGRGSHSIAPGKSIRIASGVSIDFGGAASGHISS